MEFSSEVLTGLGYLANGSHFSDDNFKKIVGSSLGLLAGEQNIDRIATICPEKADIVRKSYSAILAFAIEIARYSAEEEIKNLLGKQNLKSDRIDYFIKIFSLNKDSIVESLKNTCTSWPSIIDVNWRLDYVIKTNVLNHIGEPLYFIVLTTAKEGKIDYIKFTCNLHQLQDLCTKLKEIMDPIKIDGNVTEPWNYWGIQPPVTCTVKTNCNYFDAKDLKDTLTEALKNLKQLNVFHKEAAILSRFLYRFKRSFRQDKGFQHLVQMNQGLRRYFRLDIYGALSNIQGCMPSLSTKAAQVLLPTQQMLKWVLLRLLSLSKILERIIDMSKKSAKYLYAKLCLGWSSNYMITALAITSRILACSKFVLLKAVKWYPSLRRHLKNLQSTGDYLPSFNFPKKLENFIGDVDLKPPGKKSDMDKIFDLIDLTGANEDEDDDVIITNEIIVQSIDDSDDEVEVSKDMSIVYEKTNLNSFARLYAVEDTGSPVIKIGKPRKKPQKRKPRFYHFRKH